MAEQSCAVNFNKPCPLPKWTATWDLARSTAIHPCNFSGFYDPKYAAKWGLVSFSWQNDEPGWTPGAVDCQERMVEQCRLVKKLNPQTKCFVYRNTELALEWLSTQKAVMDEQHRGWFVNFEDDTVPHNP